MRTVHEGKRGCGYRKDGGAYLMGELSFLGTLPACVEIDPPIPLDTEVIPFTRGVYLVEFDNIFTETDQRLWLAGSSRESLRERTDREWDIARYGMPLSVRRATGVCDGLSVEGTEAVLDALAKRPGAYLEDYILAIHRAGRGRRVAAEVAKMNECIRGDDWRGLLASCHRLSGYSGEGAAVVSANLKRLAVSIGATEDAIYL